MESGPRPERRKDYEPPKFSIISLRPEEAVLGNCKTSAAAGPAGMPCTALGGCSSIGS